MEVRKYGGDALLLGYGHLRADERGGRAGRGAEVALVGRCMVVRRAMRGVIAGDVAFRLVRMARAGGTVLLSDRQLGLHLGSDSGRRTLHRHRHRSPDWEQQGKQQQEPDAE